MERLSYQSLTAAMQQDADRKNFPSDLPALPEIPAARYCDPAFHKLEIAAMKRSWLFGIHGDDVPEAGSYKKWEQLGQPLVFVRGNDKKVRCFYNICRHRGSALVLDDSGQKRTLSCPIHGWTYRLDGELAGLPERRDFLESDLKHRSLLEVRCENIGEMYFINFDDNAPSLLEDHGAIAEAWSRYQPENSRLVGRFGLTVPANYKLVLDANLEVYHVNTVHPDIVSKFLDSSASTIKLFPNGHSIQASRLRQKEWNESGIDLPRVSEVTDISQLANVAVHMFPNRIIAMNDWGYPLQNYWPVDERTTYVEVLWFAPRSDVAQSEAMWNEITATFIKVLEQDYVYCAGLQKSMESGACHGMLIGAQERCIYQMHEEMDRRIGIDRVPAHLRVRQVLEQCQAAA